MNAVLLTNELALNAPITRIRIRKVKLEVFMHIGNAMQ